MVGNQQVASGHGQVAAVCAAGFGQLNRPLVDRSIRQRVENLQGVVRGKVDLIADDYTTAKTAALLVSRRPVGKHLAADESIFNAARGEFPPDRPE